MVQHAATLTFLVTLAGMEEILFSWHGLSSWCCQLYWQYSDSLLSHGPSKLPGGLLSSWNHSFVHWAPKNWKLMWVTWSTPRNGSGNVLKVLRALYVTAGWGTSLGAVGHRNGPVTYHYTISICPGLVTSYKFPSVSERLAGVEKGGFVHFKSPDFQEHTKGDSQEWLG